VTAAFETELLPPNGAAVTDQQALVSWGPVPGAAIAIDVGSARLRDWVTQPQLDAQTEQLTWSVENTGIVPDYVVAEVTDSRTGSAGTTTWDWLIAGGGNEDGAIAYPTLPTDIFDFNFHDTDTLNVNLLGGAQTPGGYDTARPLVFDDLGLVAGDPTGLASPGTTGTAVVQQLHRVLTLPAAVRAHHHRPRHAYRTRR
jgi:hypothetical protein